MRSRTISQKQSSRATVSVLDVKMGHTLLCVLGLFLLNTLLYGHAEGQDDEQERSAEDSGVGTGPTGGMASTLRCVFEGGGDTDWKYEWTPPKLNTPPTNSEYRISSATESHSGDYRCKGRRDSYSSTEWSDIITVTVLFTNRAVVTLQSNWPEIYYGETITLRCEIMDGGDTEWEYEWTTSSSDTLPKHSDQVISATIYSGGNYWCKGKHKKELFSTEWSDPITLTLSAHRPKAELRADRRAIPAGGSVTLTCSVKPSSSGWKYFWYRGEKTSEPLTTQDADFLSDGQIRVSQGGLYWCRGGRGDPVYYTEYSDAISINKMIPNRAIVTLQPNWPQIFSGETFTVRCEIKDGGDTEWEYEWTTPISDKPLTQNEYRIRFASGSHSGDYRCKGRRDSYSSTEWSDVITVTVLSHRPKAELRADRRVIPAGGSVTLTCSVKPSSSSGWKYFWYRGEKTSEPLTAQDAVFLSDGQIRVSQGGLYWCRGGRGDPVYYTEYSDAVVTNRAVVTLQPNWPEIYYGETITLRCEIMDGGDTEWEYEWTTSSSDRLPKHSDQVISATIYSGGNYWCKGKHKKELFSTEWSDPITLTLLARRPKAELRADRRDIPAGGSVTLTCSVKPSSSGWKYFWYRGEKTSEPLTAQDAVFLSYLQVSQGGLYWCRGGRGDPVYYTESSDTISMNKIRTVPNRAIVTLQPNWPQIFSGETFTVRCEIEGGGDTKWTYEWTPAKLNTPPTNSEYRISRATESHSGDYRCKGRRDSYSSTEWSDVITVIVSDKPQPVLTVSPSWLSPADSVTLNCSVKDPSAGWTFYWYKAVPKLADISYSDELLPGSSSGTEQDSYIVHGQTHTAGYKCRAGRGAPVYYTQYSEPKFVWSGDFHSSASLTVSPDRVQHFPSDSVSLNCEGNSAEWRVRRFTEDGYPSYCSYWGTMTGSTCSIGRNRQSAAVYWCESGSGEFSNAVNITKQNGDIILVSPVRPVTEGDSVSLSCKLRTEEFVSDVFFYRNGELVQNDTRRELNISAVSKSDEGFYKCQHSGKASPQSWMSVKSSSSPYAPFQIVGLVIGILLIVPLPLLLLCWYKKSKDTCCHRLIQSQRTNQSSATVQTVNQDENQQQVYSSLLHGDVCAYETISGSGNTGSGRLADEYRNVISQIQLQVLAKSSFHDDPAESSDYCNVNPDSTAGPFAQFDNEVSIFILVLKTRLYGHAKVTNRAVVTLQPKWPKIHAGETITLRCEIKNGGDTEWEYEWRTTSSVKPLNGNEFRITPASTFHSGDYRCKGRNKTEQQSSTKWSDAFKLTVCGCKPKPVLTVSPSWLSPADSVTLNCSVKDPSAGWTFYWYKAVPKLADNSYRNELLPGSSSGTEQDSYIVHVQTHTAGYKCRAGRGAPVYYTQYSERHFVWSGDFNSAASLTVNPDRVQHFSSESVSLSCEGNSTEWRVMRLTEKGDLSHCNGKMIGSTCHIHNLPYTDAVYWCESGSGEFSNAVNITVHLSRAESHSFLMPLFTGVLTGVLLIILLLLLHHFTKSKDPCSGRPIQSQSTNQDERVNPDETQEHIYSSLREGVVCIYDSISGSEETGNMDKLKNTVMPHFIQFSSKVLSRGVNMMIQRRAQTTTCESTFNHSSRSIKRSINKTSEAQMTTRKSGFMFRAVFASITTALRIS
ncbi:obscurin-like [Siniperca chuatsi]|uniref:obscurin-like n=1 Tax=Siniperca chuatsi TaxID=119488 RepID=UPI001CE0E949|nr:obscurin-like [Siniperca chuatsi]